MKRTFFTAFAGMLSCICSAEPFEVNMDKFGDETVNFAPIGEYVPSDDSYGGIPSLSFGTGADDVVLYGTFDGIFTNGGGNVRGREKDGKREDALLKGAGANRGHLSNVVITGGDYEMKEMVNWNVIENCTFKSPAKIRSFGTLKNCTFEGEDIYVLCQKRDGKKAEFVSNGEYSGRIVFNGAKFSGVFTAKSRVELWGDNEIGDCVFLGEVVVDENVEGLDFQGNVEVGTLGILKNCTSSGNAIKNSGTVSGGTYAGKVTNQQKGTILDGTFTGDEIENNGMVSGGTFDGKVANKKNGEISDGKFNGEETTNEGKISGGEFENGVRNSNAITGGTFNNSVSNAGKIEGGTYAGKVTNEKYGRISGGTFNTADLKDPLLWLTNSGSISGGTFAVGVENKNNISGGTFNNSVSNAGGISDGTFNGNVGNNGNIKNGVFHGEVTNSKTITGGEFHGKVTNESLPDIPIMGITGSQAVIDGGVFYGEVINDFDQEGLQSSGIITDNATAVITYILGDGNTMEERYNGILKAERPLLGADKISVPEGKKFAGWYADANFSGAPVEKLAAGTFSGYTFYAKFVDEDENQGNPTAIGEVAEDGGTVVSETFYNMLGQRIAAPANGVTIVVQTLGNGTQRTVKMVK